jgi:hypothetical protein
VAIPRYYRCPMFQRHFVGLLLVGMVLACNPFKPSGNISMGANPVAVGAYWEASLNADDILGAGAWPIGPMTVTLSDPSVARIVPDSEIPEGMGPAGRWTLQALAPGETVLSMESDFDDGHHRRAETTVHVRAFDSVNISPVCDKNVALPMRMPAGAFFKFYGVLQGGGKPLGGYYPGAFAGDNVTCTDSQFLTGSAVDASECLWSAPADGGSVTISSPPVPAFSATLQAYLPAEVTAIVADLASGTRQLNTAGLGGGTLPTYVKLAGGRPCEPMGIAVMTLSPSVCAGPSGETAWTGGGLPDPSETDKPEWVSYTSLAEGDCQLALGAAGATNYPSIVHVPTRVATEVTAAHTVHTYQGCATAGAVTCHESFAGVSVCNGKTWDEPKICPPYQACEFLLAGDQGCGVSTGCARCR